MRITVQRRADGLVNLFSGGKVCVLNRDGSFRWGDPAILKRYLASRVAPPAQS